MTAVRTLPRITLSAGLALGVTLALTACGTTRRTVMVPRFSEGFDATVATEQSYSLDTETARRRYELRATAIGRTLILVAAVDAPPESEVDPGPFVGTATILAGACRIQMPISAENSGSTGPAANVTVLPDGCTTLESSEIRVTGEGASRRLEVEIRLPYDVMRQNDGSLRLDFNEDGVEDVVTLPADGEIRCVYLQK